MTRLRLVGTVRSLFAILVVTSPATAARGALAQVLPMEAPHVGGRAVNVRYTLSAQPVATFGTAAGAEPSLLSGVVGTARLADGTIAIGDAGNYRVVLVGPHGAVTTSGRRGDGPGEFKLPIWAGLCGSDQFAVFDAAKAALTYVTASGRLANTRPLPASIGFSQIVSCDPQAGVWVLFNQPVGELQPGQVRSVSTVLARYRGDRMDTVAAEGVQDFYTGRGVAAFIDIPLGHATLVAAGGGRVYLCHSMRGSVSVFDSSGARRETFRVDVPRRTVSPAQWATIVKERLARHPFARTRMMIGAVLSEIPPPREAPAFDMVQVDALGYLWIRTLEGLDSEASTWVVLNATGVPQAAVATPRRLRISEIGRDYLMGVLPDDDGVERVVLYSLTRQ